MNIEDSSTPYRSFVRSGAYPALSQRVVRSGGVLVQAAGWFALVVTAASAGYQMTQRLVPPAAAAAPSFSPARTSAAEVASAAPAASQHSAQAQQDTIVDEVSTRRPSSPLVEDHALLAPAAAAAVAARKRTGAVVQPAAPEPKTHDGEELDEPEVIDHTEQIAQRVQALDEAPRVAVPSPLPASLGARVTAPSPVREARPVLPKKEVVSLSLKAAAKIDGLAVKGPLSAAHVRRSVERVRPTLSGCYEEAAQRAGENRFSQVRVVLTIDEAGRVKMLPRVEGAQLPGLETCLSLAMSKLVCQAPDTGTARAAIVLGFAPTH